MAFNSNAGEAETGGSMSSIQGQPVPQSWLQKETLPWKNKQTPQKTPQKVLILISKLENIERDPQIKAKSL